MLNYNKIHSAINFDRTSKTKLAEYIGIAHTTLRSRLDRENLTPEDVEKIAEFFKKPIAYFFDKEGKEVGVESIKGSIKCKECEKKDEEIKRLNIKIGEINAELSELYKKYSRALEELQGKRANEA